MMTNTTKKTTKKRIEITDSKSCIKALKALGYERAAMDLTRGAKSFKHRANPNVLVTVSPGNYLITGGGWGYIPMALHIANLAHGASTRTLELIERLKTMGIITEVEELNNWQFCVAIARGAIHDKTALSEAPNRS
jgi:predicted RNA binding protein YcfA (HicA-like mRNA interferase family)